MKKEVTKKVTIDDLAVMIAEGREETNELARMVAKGFDGMREEMNGRFDKVEKEVAEVKENLAGTRRDVLEIGDRFVPRYEFHNLLVRFDRLEQKVAGK
ncbi:MAG: hypothetical protein HZB10_03870 [Candidatus Yonathbacteria bacterium]|nr:hypothetical protein [Candidatus Yonathbacteria bacterium]